MPRSLATTPLITTLAVAVLPSAALAQQASPPGPTVTATGTAQIKPAPGDRHSDNSIRAAVEAAYAKALPQAVADARADAARLATAAGLSLGPLVSISDAQAAGYPPFIYAPQNGTFGNGHFCGQVRNFRTKVGPNGVRRRILLKGTHKVCRVPGTVAASVSVTYAVAA
jgi:Protein of unknown function (DUF541)